MSYDPIREQQRRTEFNYLQKAKKAYNIIADQELWDPDFQDSSENYAHRKFREGVETKIVTGSFDEFFGYLKGYYYFWTWTSGEPYSRTSPRRNSAFYDRHHLHFREGMRYRQFGHAKKEENPKQVWRDHKQFRRDHSKCGYRRLDHASTWDKRMVARANRRHWKNAVRSDRDEMASQKVQDVIRRWWD